jgi:membrane-associated protein
LIGGYTLGTHPLVKENFHWVIVAIVVISALPIFYEWFKAYRQNKLARIS